jgi:sortase (surface protein transpeptidase)
MTTSSIVDLVLPKGIYINDVVLYSNKQGLENLAIHEEEEQPAQQEDQQQEEEQKPPEIMPWFNFNNDSENKTQNPEEDEKPQKEGDLFDSY